MRTTKTKMKVLAAATLLALAPFAHADDATTASGSLDTQVKALDDAGAKHGQAQVAARIAAQFRGMAGSDANALALVNGLRNGSDVTLTSTSTTTTNGKPTTTTTTTTIDTPTKPMGWGNVRIALALAQAELQQAGITKPTAAQLQAALTGGTLKSPDGTTTQAQGVLTMRASGMGWGQIAQAQGTKLGPVLASLHHTQHEIAKLPVKGDDGGDKTAASKSKAAMTTTRTTSNPSTGGPSSKTTLTTGAGTTTASSTAHGSKGLTTASGSPSSSSSSKGLVTASGASVPTAGAAMNPHANASGITTATGATASASGVTTAQGGSGDAHGNGHGKGKGG